MRAAPYPRQLIQIFLQQDTVQAVGAALQPKSVLMFRTCFHPHTFFQIPVLQTQVALRTRATMDEVIQLGRGMEKV